MPEFLKIKKALFVGGGDKIHVKPDLDYQRVAQCKSKKAKGVYELMKTFKTGANVESYQQNAHILGQQLHISAW